VVRPVLRMNASSKILLESIEKKNLVSGRGGWNLKSVFQNLNILDEKYEINLILSKLYATIF